MNDETNKPKLPPWLQPLLQKAQPAAAHLITGDKGVGADLLALELAAKFAGVIDIEKHPDIMVVRPIPPKSARKSADNDSGGGNDGGDANAEKESKGKKKKANLAIRIEQAHDIIEFCALMPMALPRKIVVVLAAEKMNIPTANALLKTLEEPGATKMFILRARSAKQLPPTIVSRCRVESAPPPTPEQAREWLQENGGDETALHYSGGLPFAMDAEKEIENAETRAAIIAELNKGAKADIAAAAEVCAKNDEWFDCLQKWAADGARIASGVTPRYFPAAAEKLRALNTTPQQWLNLHARLIKRRRLLEHPLAADLRIKEALHACRRTFTD